MAHIIKYNPTDKIIEAQFQGDVTLHLIKEYISDIAKTVKEQNCFVVLNDMHEVTVKLSILEIYNLPKIISKIVGSQGLELHKIKRAFVAPKGLKDMRFFETVTVNRGQNTRYFFDINKARDWLLGK